MILNLIGIVNTSLIMVYNVDEKLAVNLNLDIMPKTLKTMI